VEKPMYEYAVMQKFFLQHVRMSSKFLSYLP